MKQATPLSVDDAFPAPLCGLTVYGKSTQDGTPSPDNPVPIVSAGDGGSLTVKVTGKNLIPTNCGQNTTALRYDAQYNRWVFDALKAVGLVNARIIDPETARYLLAAGTYTITLVSSENVQNVTISAVNFDWKTLASVVPGMPSKTFSVNANTIVGCYFVPTDVNATGYLQVQLELGTTATAYSPYREQLITLPTPNGLPGIPVTSGGSYTDSTGQQWVCDEVNFEKGVKVQRIASFVINAENANNFFVTNDFTNVTVATNARLQTTQKTNRDDRRNGRCIFCEALPWSINAWASSVNAAGFIKNNSVDLTIENSYLGLSEASTNAERKTALVKYFTDRPCQVVYRIATPIETPLTPDEIAAYKALTTYAPDTVVQAGDGAGVKLEYQRDVNLVVKNLEDAIASMTTT